MHKFKAARYKGVDSNEDDDDDEGNSDDGHPSNRRANGFWGYEPKEITPLCLCDEHSVVFTSKQPKSFGREFYTCQTRTCKYFKWKDQVVLQAASSKLPQQQQVDPQKINHNYRTEWDENIAAGNVETPYFDPDIGLLPEEFLNEHEQETSVSQSSKISPLQRQTMPHQSVSDRDVNNEKNDIKSTNEHAGGGATYVPSNSLLGPGAEVSCDELLKKQLSLSSKQLDVLKAILEKKNVFFSGAAGTGKSHVINVIKDIIKVLGLESRFAFTATTGVAACNIGGVTIHSWSGIGTVRFEDKGEPELTIGRASAKKEVKRRWRTTDFLFIDEISMFRYSLTHSLIHSFIHSLIHLLTYLVRSCLMY